MMEVSFRNPGKSFLKNRLLGRKLQVPQILTPYATLPVVIQTKNHFYSFSADEKAAAETEAAHEAEIQALQDSLAASARALAHLAGGSSRASSPREHGPVTNLDHHIRRVQRRISESEVTAARVEELENRVSDLDRALEARDEELKRVRTEQAEAAVAAGVESVELRRQFVEASEELTRVRKQLVDVQRTSDTWQDKEQKLRGELRIVKEEKEKTSEELTAVQRQVRAANEEATRVRGQMIDLQVRRFPQLVLD